MVAEDCVRAILLNLLNAYRKDGTYKIWSTRDGTQSKYVCFMMEIVFLPPPTPEKQTETALVYCSDHEKNRGCAVFSHGVFLIQEDINKVIRKRKSLQHPVFPGGHPSKY